VETGEIFIICSTDQKFIWSGTVPYNTTVIKLKELIVEANCFNHDDYCSCGEKTTTSGIYFRCKRLQESMQLCNYGIKNGSVVIYKHRVKGGGMDIVYEHLNRLIFCSFDRSSEIELFSYHISCRSDKIEENDKEDIVGIVLYQYDRQSKWIKNNVKCQTGYVFLKKTKNLENFKEATYHASCYKSLFDESVDSKIIGGGFARVDNEWKYNSSTFNSPQQCVIEDVERNDGFHNDKREMHPIEIKWLKISIDNWMKTCQQTTKIDYPNCYFERKGVVHVK